MGFKKKFKPITEQEHIDRVVKPILDTMEKGQVPWHMPWEISQNAQGTIVAGVNRSLSSGKLYEGINSLLLSLIANQEQYKNRYWGTYLGIKKAGGRFAKARRVFMSSSGILFLSSKVKTIAPNARVLLSTSKARHSLETNANQRS